MESPANAARAPKKVLMVYAHPEPRSLNGALKDLAVRHLEGLGHSVRVSDLYAMNWKANADRGDFTDAEPSERLFYANASKAAFVGGTQTDDVAAEQEKLLWADAVILQFPMWWFSMPAILKGWIDRVYAYGFAYGVGEHGGERWGDRYGEGELSGRRAMLSVSMGGRAPHYGDRGVNGSLDDLLFPIQHGILFYPGMDVLPPFAMYHADRVEPEQWHAAASSYARRLDGLFTDPPISFRKLNGGHYDGQQVLKPGLGEGASGTRIHVVRANEPPELPVGKLASPSKT